MREEGSRRLWSQARPGEGQSPEGPQDGPPAWLGPEVLDQLTRRAESEVKRRLARELHDSVAQILTQMVVDMESFKLDQSDQRQVVERVDHLQESTREVLTNLRQVLYDLREEPSFDNSFVQSVRQLLSRFERSTGIRSKLRVSARWPACISAAAAYNLYRIVEEALNNVRLHSGAARVDVLLQAVGDGVALTVRDDGRGLQRLGDQRRGGMGLLGMQERAALLGGEVNVISRGGRGTTVRAVVPKIAKEMSR